MILTPTTDLTQFAGQRVTINGARTALVQTIRHGAEAVTCREALAGGVWGNSVHDPHPGCQGGAAAFFWEYGTDLAVVVEVPA